MVSGAPRSGTTFVGTILGRPANVNTIYEPFNPDAGVAWNAQRYLHLGDAAALTPAQRRHLIDFFAYRFTLKTVHSPRDKALERTFKRVAGGGNQLALLRGRLNPFASVSLIKDPIAVFLAETFADFNAVQTLMMVRHPLSFVGSLKRLRWRFKLAPIIEQESLRSRWAAELSPGSVDPNDWLAASSWIWTVINSFVLDVAARRPEVTAMTQEHLSEQPDAAFRTLFDHFGLTYTPRIAREVAALSSTAGKGASSANVVHDFRRESAAIFASSTALLTDEERRKVLDICWPTASQIYAETEGPATRDDFISAYGPKSAVPA